MNDNHIIFKYIQGFLFSLTLIPVVFAQTPEMEELQQIEQERITTIARISESVISVFPAQNNGPIGGGSGVLISPDGYALTNFHVVQPCGPAMKCGLPNGQVYNTILVGVDPTGDVALIKLLGREDFPYASLGDSDQVQVGDEAFVLGNPFLIATDFRPCVSCGIISGLHRYQYPAGSFLEYTDCLQTDAAINPGNSGGPLFDQSGCLIGINGRCSFEKRGRINVGIGYAVSINQIKNFLGSLKSGRILDHATLSTTVITDRMNRVQINHLLSDCELYRLGVRAGDEVIRLANRPIDTANTFKNILGIFPNFWRIPVTIRDKAGNRRELLVRLASLHSDAELTELFRTDISQLENSQPKDSEPTIPRNHKEESATIPDWAKPYYEQRSGFTNYHFNRLKRDQILTLWRGMDFDGEIDSEPWSFFGSFSDSGSYRLTIGETGVELETSEQKLTWTKNDSVREPQGSGGLFPALYLFRKLAVNHPLDFGEVFYLGTALLDGNPARLFEVIDVIWNSGLARFYFDQEETRLRCIEFFPASKEFPCEIHFHYSETNQSWFADLLKVQFNTTPFSRLVVEKTVPELPAKRDSLQQGVTSRDISSQHDSSLQQNGSVPTIRSLTSLESVQEKVVRLYGSGGFAGMQGYQSGCLISPQGHIVTVLSSVLEKQPVVTVLANGRRYVAELLHSDPITEIALLKIDANHLPYFELDEQIDFRQGTITKTNPVQIGDSVLAVSNPFNIAVGNEALSIQQGIVAARTSLRARRGVFTTPYQGPVFVLDVITNNPGAKGGAIVQRESGHLIGMIGKELKNSENDTWFNFVIPTRILYEQLGNRVHENMGTTEIDRISSKDMQERRTEEPLPFEAVRMLRKRGIILISNISERTPSFVESVRSGSPAQQQGIQPDDLIVLINNQLAPSQEVLIQHLIRWNEVGPLRLTLERNFELIDVVLE